MSKPAIYSTCSSFDFQGSGHAANHVRPYSFVSNETEERFVSRCGVFHKSTCQIIRRPRLETPAHKLRPSRAPGPTGGEAGQATGCRAEPGSGGHSPRGVDRRAANGSRRAEWRRLLGAWPDASRAGVRPWRKTRRLADFVLRPVGGVAWVASAGGARAECIAETQLSEPT